MDKDLMFMRNDLMKRFGMPTDIDINMFVCEIRHEFDILIYKTGEISISKWDTPSIVPSSFPYLQFRNYIINILYEIRFESVLYLHKNQLDYISLSVCVSSLLKRPP